MIDNGGNAFMVDKAEKIRHTYKYMHHVLINHMQYYNYVTLISLMWAGSGSGQYVLVNCVLCTIGIKEKCENTKFKKKL